MTHSDLRTETFSSNNITGAEFVLFRQEKEIPLCAFGCTYFTVTINMMQLFIVNTSGSSTSFYAAA